MTSGDNNEQMPAKGSTKVEVIESLTEVSLGRSIPVQKLPKGRKLKGPLSEENQGVALLPNKDESTKRAMEASDMEVKIKNPIGVGKKRSTAKAPPPDEALITSIQSFFGPDVKPWLEAQEMHLKREESQRALSTTVESLSKDKQLKEVLRGLEKIPLAPHPLAIILKRCVDRNYLLGTKDLKKFEKELKRYNFDLGTTYLTLKGFMHLSAGLNLAPIQQLLASPDWESLAKEYKLMELLLELHAHRLIRDEENIANIYSALPPGIKNCCGRFDGDLNELIKLREILERDTVKKHLNGTRLAGQSPEDRFLSLLLNLVEKEGLDPETDYRLVYGALPLKRKGELVGSGIKINNLTQIRKALDKDSIKRLFKEWHKLSLSPSEIFVELVLALRAEKLIPNEMTPSQAFSALPPKVRAEMKFSEMPFADIANFRGFFAGQSIQARLHVLRGSDKTPWQKFQELNRFLYDPLNEATNGHLKGTLPADYYELHSWLPPELRVITSPNPDDEELTLDNREENEDLESEEQSQDDNCENTLIQEDSEEAEEDEIFEASEDTGNLITAENSRKMSAITSSPPLSSTDRDVRALDREDVTEEQEDFERVAIAPQSRVSLAFAPRFGDHSIRQRTSLDLRSYLSAPSHAEALASTQIASNNLDNSEASSGVVEVVDLPEESAVYPVAEHSTMDDLGRSDSFRPSERLQTDYRSGRTWGDDDELTDEVEFEDTDSSFDADYENKAELPSAEQAKEESEEFASFTDSDEESEIQEASLVKPTTGKQIDDNGWESVTYKVGANAWTPDYRPKSDPPPFESSIDNSVEQIAPLPVAPLVVEQQQAMTTESQEPGKGDSVADHLAYTAAANITPEERLLEFAVFLNKNEMLAATHSLSELYEKLPPDIKPGFKLMDFDLWKFLEFRQDISRHFVKEHLRSTKEMGLEGEDRFAEFLIFLKKNGLMPPLPDSAEVYKLIPIPLKREFGNVLATGPINLELRKNLLLDAVKSHLESLEQSKVSPEERLVELGIFLDRNNLLASVDNLQDLYSQLPFDMRRSFKRYDANLKLITSLRNVLEKEMINEHLRNTQMAGLGEEERFIELVIFLKRNELIGQSVSPIDVFTALPVALKGQLKRCDFPSETIIQVRDSLDKPPVQQQIEILKKMWFNNQEKFMELAVFMKQNGYLPPDTNATLLYCGLPASLKKELNVIDLPLEGVVQLRKNLEKEFVKAHIRSSEGDNLSPEERFVELAVFLYRNELIPDMPNLDDVYTALPADLRLEFSRTEIPLEQIMLFRDILDKRSVREQWNRSRSLGGSGEDRFADLVVFLKREGLLLFEDNLGHFYTALPVEFKRELSNFTFKVETITRLKNAIRAAEMSAQV